MLLRAHPVGHPLCLCLLVAWLLVPGTAFHLWTYLVAEPRASFITTLGAFSHVAAHLVGALLCNLPAVISPLVQQSSAGRARAAGHRLALQLINNTAGCSFAHQGLSLYPLQVPTLCLLYEEKRNILCILSLSSQKVINMALPEGLAPLWGLHSRLVRQLI